jgi:hypothetical protein
MATIPRAFLLTLALAAPLLLSAGNAVADKLVIENVAAGAAAGERPARGSSMARVEARFGAPATRSGPVGQPPITRWDYPDFVVFFEYDHVVHAVGR